MCKPARKKKIILIKIVPHWHLSVKLLANFENGCQDGTTSAPKLKCIYQLWKDLSLERIEMTI